MSAPIMPRTPPTSTASSPTIRRAQTGSKVQIFFDFTDARHAAMPVRIAENELGDGLKIAVGCDKRSAGTPHGAHTWLARAALVTPHAKLKCRTLEETAAVMNRSPRAVQGLLDRAKKKMRDAIGRLSLY